MIHALTDVDLFRRRAAQAWAQNSSYWLSQPLRHVTDTGDWIVERVAGVCHSAHGHKPIVLDMGFGSCWLLQRILERGLQVRYVGFDNNPTFVDAARSRFGSNDIVFKTVNVEQSALGEAKDADIVVNAYNFFELADLDTAMENASQWLCEGGRLLTSTIDKTYLILALSKGWDNFIENLRDYQQLPGVKYGFQRIDLGHSLSDSLEYPSVLYSTQDYLSAAKKAGLRFHEYTEQAFTARPMPKIYTHIEFIK